MSRSLRESVLGVEAGSLGPSEVVGRSLAAAARLQPDLNAFISVDADRARAAAAAIEHRRPARELALRGVPIAFKDMFDRAGHCCTFGAPFGQERPARATATPLRRLEEQGAILIGALNMSEFALGPTGHNVTFGPCRNPHDLDRVAGGSSSGAGAAVASGIVDGAIGSDTGGSNRIPAACCGVVGLKPTYGAVSRHGAMPLSFSLDCVGPIARTVAECATLFRAISGADPEDPTSMQTGRCDPQPDAEPASIRLRYPADAVAARCDADVTAVIDKAVSALKAHGAEVLDADVGEIPTLHMLADVIQKAESSAAHLGLLHRRRDGYSRHVRRRIEGGYFVAASAYVQALSQRGPRLQAFLQRVLGDSEGLVIPTLGVVTPLITETDEEELGGIPDLVARMTAWTRWVNYLGLPALSLPVGRDRNGMPIGLQLVGRPGGEARLFQIARVIEAQAEPLPPPRWSSRGVP